MLARKRLEKNHPLYYDKKIGMSEIFPTLKIFDMCRCKSKAEEEDSFLDDDDLKSESSHKDNPVLKKAKTLKKVVFEADKNFMKLGYGTVGYLNFHEYTIIIFLILSILSAPSLYYFTTYSSSMGPRL